ncbi:MAG: pyridoxamine 5'-phosphate oxidase family protein [Desulfitobacteriaceae bacterium]
MFKQLRRSDRKMDVDGAISLLTKGDYGILSTTGADGYAYGVPLSFVFMNNTIYFHGATDGHKYENILHNDKVSFCVVGEIEPLPEKFSMKYQSVIVFGKVMEVTGDEKREALMALVQKYASSNIEKGKQYVDSDESKTKVLKLDIKQVSGKIRI